MAMVVALPFLDPHKEWLQEGSQHHSIRSGVFDATGIMAVRAPQFL